MKYQAHSYRYSETNTWDWERAGVHLGKFPRVEGESTHFGGGGGGGGGGVHVVSSIQF